MRIGLDLRRGMLERSAGTGIEAIDAMPEQRMEPLACVFHQGPAAKMQPSMTVYRLAVRNLLLW
jgi:hypothetical protein